MPFVLGAVLMLALGGGGFFAVYSGLVFGHPGESGEPEAQLDALPDIAFIPIDPLVIALSREPSRRFLHFTAQLEVAKIYQADVTHIMPRILDVLNSYLRAVEIGELEEPAALVRLRAQMLRRVQMVAGEGRVRDLLVTEFVIN